MGGQTSGDYRTIWAGRIKRTYLLYQAATLCRLRRKLEELAAQRPLGREGFADVLRGPVTGEESIRDIPKGQKLIGRASLKKLFDKAWKEKAMRALCGSLGRKDATVGVGN